MAPVRHISALLLVIGLCWPTFATAREERSEQVPNGQKLDCNLCHTDGGGTARNPFGQQIEMMGLSGVGAIETQEVEWAAVFDLDADGDGFTNGYELGDPDGMWVPIDNDPAVDPSLPGDADSVPCPNGSVHPGEDCDGEDLAGQTCLSQGFTGGTLACTAQCTFDTSGCMAAQFPDQGVSDPNSDMGTGTTGPNMPNTPSNPQGGADTGESAGLTASDVSGCAGTLDVEYGDAGLDASMLLLLFVFPRGRRCDD